MSMSMCVDHQHGAERTLTIRPRLPVTWIPDERVSSCFDCSCKFSLFRRKHHCRSCGRIFCDSCTLHRERIPHHLSEQRQRVCGSCQMLLRRVHQVDGLICMLANMPVTFAQLFQLRLLNKEWNYAVNTLLGQYRGLQYKLPNQRYSKVEQNFLKSHFQEFKGHVQWQIHAILAMVQCQEHVKAQIVLEEYTMPPQRCRLLLCSRTCRSVLTVADVMTVAPALHSHCLQKEVVQAWRGFPIHVHVKMMFWWVHLGLHHPRLFEEGLLVLCSRHTAMAYALWFECELAKNKSNVVVLQQVQDCLCAAVNPTILSELKKTILFHGLLLQMVRGVITLSFFRTYHAVRLPWDPSLSVCGLTDAKQLKSSSRPIQIDLKLTTGQTLRCLLKMEDVRTDRLSMVVGYWINAMTSNVVVHTYPVFPLNGSCGCIAMMPNATTLYDIRQTTTLTNYMLSHNADDTVKSVRLRFITSCVGACLLAFTMGLGDRHLENIMVTERAQLSHVDFGYILGEDPKHVHTTMRITNDMVEAMGGRQSATFQLFTTLITEAYQAMRLHSSFWYQLLSSEYLIFHDKRRTLELIRRHVQNRFVPGEWNDVASLHIESIVESASTSSWTHKVVDLVHRASNHLNV
jgi:hypothetical protein